MKREILLFCLWVLPLVAVANVAPPELVCRAQLIHAANRTVRARLRHAGYRDHQSRYEFDTPLGTVTLTQAAAVAPEAVDPEEAFASYFLPTVDRDRNWVVSSPASPWFHPGNYKANCHAFASASRVAIPPDCWLPAEKIQSLTYGDGYEVLLRSYFDQIADGPIADAQAVLSGEGAREGDLVVFGRGYPNYFLKEHSGLLFWHDGEWRLLHKVGEGPTLLTPIDDVLTRYDTNVRDFRVYRGTGEER